MRLDPAAVRTTTSRHSPWRSHGRRLGPAAGPLGHWSSRSCTSRGATKRRPDPEAGTFAGLVAELPRLAALGVSVIELLPVHQFDPDEGNYWGYMALVFGAVHQQYAFGDDANAELGDLVAAAHDHDIEVWLDVVFNHTTEEDDARPDVQPARAGGPRVLPARRTTARTSTRPAAATSSTPTRRWRGT